MRKTILIPTPHQKKEIGNVNQYIRVDEGILIYISRSISVCNNIVEFGIP